MVNPPDSSHPLSLSKGSPFVCHDRGFAQVTEACLGGNLLEWIDQLKGQEVVIRRIAQEVTGVLAHCHSRYLGCFSTNLLFFLGI